MVSFIGLRELLVLTNREDKKEGATLSSGCVYVGVDIGSTTAKLVIRDGETIIYKKYERHYS